MTFSEKLLIVATVVIWTVNLALLVEAVVMMNQPPPAWRNVK